MKNARLPAGRQGQTALEVAIVAPLFMIFAFLVLQLGHIGIGIAIVNYGASSVARLAVAQNGYNQGEADTRFQKIIFAGLKDPSVLHVADQDGIATTNLKVTTCAQLPAFPLVGTFLYQAIRTGSTAALGGCPGASKWIGPVGLSAPPYHFIIQGQAVARMNYNAKG